MSRPVVILGAGGHARVVVDALLAAHRKILGLTDSRAERAGELVLGIAIIGTDDEVAAMEPDDVELAVGIGSVKSTRPRADLFERFCSRYSFTRVVHPSAIVASDARLEDGAQVMAGAVVQTGAVVGRNAIVNTNASVDHDCEIGEHVHIAPGSTLSGGVRVGSRTHVGAGATILQGIKIGEECMIAAGAVVLADVPDGSTFIPGRASRDGSG